MSLYKKPSEGVNESRVLELITENCTGHTQEEIVKIINDTGVPFKRGTYTGTGTTTTSLSTGGKVPKLVVLGGVNTNKKAHISTITFFYPQSSFKEYTSENCFNVTWNMYNIAIDWGNITTYNVSGYTYYYIYIY